MVQVGVLNEGFLNHPLKKLENGFVIPDVSVAELHKYNQMQIKNQVKYSTRAEELGYDYVFHPENHLKLSGKNSPSPLQIQTAIAAQTDEIRLVQMANILPWHEPIHLAEQIGVLDTLSGGRVGVGIGTGSGPREMAVFGQYWGDSSVDDEANWESFVAKYEILIKAWTKDSFEHSDQFHDIPPEDVEWDHDQEYYYLRDEVSECNPNNFMADDGSGTIVLDSVSVFPQPKQNPHPPIWKPAGSSQSVDWAAQQGANACLYCTNFSDSKDLINRYYDTAEKEGWPDRRPEHDGKPFCFGWDEQRQRGVAAQIPVFNRDVASEEAYERWKLGQEFELSLLKSWLPLKKAKKVPIDAEKKVEAKDAPIVGSSEYIIDRLTDFRDYCGYEDFIIIPILATPGMTHEDKLVQLQAFAEQIVPHLSEKTNV